MLNVKTAIPVGYDGASIKARLIYNPCFRVLLALAKNCCGISKIIHSPYQRRSNFFRRTTAVAFITIRKASKTMVAAEVRSTKARSGLSAHR